MTQFKQVRKALDAMDSVRYVWLIRFAAHICRSESERSTINRLNVSNKTLALIVHDRILCRSEP